MRILLAILLLLAFALTVLCAACYFGAQGQQIETRAELRQSQSTGQPITDTDIAVHVSRVGRQGRNWGIAGVLAAVCGASALAALVLATRRPTA